MVAAQEIGDALGDRHRVAEVQAASPVFHSQHDDQKQNDRALRAVDRDVLSEPVIKELALQHVQHDESEIRRERDDVDPMEPGRVVTHMMLGVEDQTPYGQLMRHVAGPGGQMSPNGRVRKLPVIPGGSLIRRQIGAGQSLTEQPDEAGQ